MRINWSALEHLTEWKELLDALELQADEAISGQDYQTLERLGNQLYDYIKKSPPRAWILDQRALAILDQVLIRRREWIAGNINENLDHLEQKVDLLNQASEGIEKNLQKDLLSDLVRISGRMKKALNVVEEYSKELSGDERLRDVIESLMKTLEELHHIYDKDE